MKLTFLGTRAWTEVSNRRHRRHAALLVTYHDRHVMVDCGADWRGRLDRVRPDAIVLTHAHPDHAWGLADGFDGPVLATADTWADIDDYPIPERRTLVPSTPTELAGLTIEAFGVLHATRAPTVALKLGGDATLLYAPDVVDIDDRAAALAGCDLYVGDGVSLTRSHVRRTGGTLVGHTTIRAQLGWCQEAGVPHALFTHCGREIIAGDERSLGPELRRLGAERGVEAGFAHDGMELALPGTRNRRGRRHVGRPRTRRGRSSMHVTIVIGQDAEIDLGQPVLQQLEGGAYTTTRIAPGGHRILISGDSPGEERLRFQLEDESEIDIDVTVT